MRISVRASTLAAAVALTVVGSFVAAANLKLTGMLVSQKNRHFNPGEVSVNQGDSIIVVNDDGDLLHHAYVESDDFNFDSGDQQPGSRTPITFTSKGDFKVLCGIHPKMKLLVHVR